MVTGGAGKRYIRRKLPKSTKKVPKKVSGDGARSDDSDGRNKLVQSVGLRVLSGTCKRINGDPEAGTNRLDKNSWRPRHSASP